MAGDSPAEAIDAFLRRVRSTLSCITTATVYASRPVAGVPRSLILFAEGQHEHGRILLSTHGGQGDLFFRFTHQFTTQRVPDIGGRAKHQVTSSFYQYRILDYEEHEIVVYHWHPSGKSPVTDPHLHASAAGSIVLQQRAGSQLAGQKTYLGNFHLPTGRIFLESVVELLVREFAVDLLRPDWETIPRENRAAIGRE